MKKTGESLSVGWVMYWVGCFLYFGMGVGELFAKSETFLDFFLAVVIPFFTCWLSWFGVGVQIASWVLEVR